MFYDKIVEVIKDGEIVRMPESKAQEEDLFVLRQVVDVEPAYTGKTSNLQTGRFSSEITQKQSNKLEEWKSKSFGFKKNDVVKDLIENFHWTISKVRRGKGLTRKQLADLTGVAEEDIRSIEMGDLPSDDFVLIGRIEQALGGINLRKESKNYEVSFADLQKRNEEKKKEKSEKLEGKSVKTSEILGKDIEIIE